MRSFCRAAKFGLVAARLHAFLEPAADARVLDVHVLDADGPAVGLAQGGEQFAQGAARQAEERAGVEECGRGRRRQARTRAVPAAGGSGGGLSGSRWARKWPRSR